MPPAFLWDRGQTTFSRAFSFFPTLNEKSPAKTPGLFFCQGEQVAGRSGCGAGLSLDGRDLFANLGCEAHQILQAMFNHVTQDALVDLLIAMHEYVAQPGHRLEYGQQIRRNPAVCRQKAE